MNWVDIAIIFVIAVTSLYSLMWGFIRQLMLVACFAVALYVALNYSGFVFQPPHCSHLPDQREWVAPQSWQT